MERANKDSGKVRMQKNMLHLKRNLKKNYVNKNLQLVKLLDWKLQNLQEENTVVDSTRSRACFP